MHHLKATLGAPVWIPELMAEQYQRCSVTRPNFAWPKFVKKAVFVRTFCGRRITYVRKKSKWPNNFVI